MHCEYIWVYDKVFLSLVSAELIHTSNDRPNTESERKKYNARVNQKVNKFY